MRKKFKAKKTSKFKYIIFLLVIYISYQFAVNVFTEMKLVKGNDAFLKNLIENSNYYNNYEKKSKNIFSKLGKVITNLDLNDPVQVFNKSFTNNNKIKNSNTDSDNLNLKELENISKHINDPNPVQNESPIVYIYNSHQLENYSNKGLEAYNITPNVMMASYLLKEKLNKLGIPTVAEDANLIEFMNANNWNHNDSYKASRVYVMNALNKYPDLKLIIDVHRDAISKEASTVKINNKNYARTLFVVGRENDIYVKNKELTGKLNDLFNKNYPKLSRGILERERSTSVNGIYNQDLNPNMTLLEIGAHYNTLDEVLNTIDAISEVIKEYFENEKRG